MSFLLQYENEEAFEIWNWLVFGLSTIELNHQEAWCCQQQPFCYGRAVAISVPQQQAD